MSARPGVTGCPNQISRYQQTPLHPFIAVLTPYKEDWIVGPQNTEFYTRTYTVHPALPKPTAHIIYLHAYYDHVGRHEHVFPQWTARGISVFAYDKRGFGRTALDRWHNGSNKGQEMSETEVEDRYCVSSWEQEMEDIAFFIGREKERVGDIPIFLFGCCMGGHESLAFACGFHKHKEVIKSLSGIIAASPSIAPAVKSNVTAIQGDKLDIGLALLAKWVSKDDRVVQSYRSDALVRSVGHIGLLTDMHNCGIRLQEKDHEGWPENLPLLIAHGSADTLTSQSVTKALFDKLGARDKRYSLYSGAFHELHNEPNGVGTNFIDECIVWVLTHT